MKMGYHGNLRLAKKAGIDPFALNIAWTLDELWPEAAKGPADAFDALCGLLEEAILKDSANRSTDDYAMALRYLIEGCGKTLDEIGRKDVIRAIPDGVGWYAENAR